MKIPWPKEANTKVLMPQPQFHYHYQTQEKQIVSDHVSVSHVLNLFNAVPPDLRPQSQSHHHYPLPNTGKISQTVLDMCPTLFHVIPLDIWSGV